MAFSPNSPKSRTAVPPGQGAPVVAELGVPPDALRAMVTTLVQEVLHAEFDRFVGAAPYERSPDRQGYRNGT